MNRRIEVPKGFLRHVALQLFKHGPMSGSEIRDQVFEYTDYRPSPGSVYPPLAMPEGIGRPGLFHGHDGRYYVSEGRLRNMRERQGM